VREGQIPFVNVHLSEFRTAPQRGKHFAGVQSVIGIERAFHPLLLFEIDLVEHRGHEIALLDADAMLAGKDSANLDAEPEDGGAEGFGPFCLARLVSVVKDERVKVSVAGMEHIRDAQTEFARHVLHLFQDEPELVAGDCAVHAKIVRAYGADGRERVLAA
jgi:hypothetical protein